MSRGARPQRPPPTLPKLKRATATVDPRRLLVVCCEGETERDYLEDYNARHRSQAVVEVRVVGSCGAPSSVVEAAIDLCADLRARLRAGRAPSSIQVSAWAVVDRDEHPPAVLGRARDLARSNDVGLVLSNPCFELWPLLHFTDQRAWIHRHDCQKLLCEWMPSYHHDKHPYVDIDLLAGREAEAERRARQLQQQHEETGADDPNPSTELWRLLAAIRGG